MDKTVNIHFINELWDKQIIPTLMEYIKIPNKSPHFDPDWQKHGYMQQAVNLIAEWCKQQNIPNLILEIIQLEQRTPLIYIEIPGNHKNTVLLYGHLDKQPEMFGWDNDLGPWQPVLREDRLYGRGAADDGYAVFAALAAIQSLSTQHVPHGRCIILIEASEESGSPDLSFYMNVLKDRIAKPDLIICLDSGCGNYHQLWRTTSLRGLLTFTLKIAVLTQGIHSGLGGGIVPSCWQILRQLINRIEDENTGDIKLNELFVNIPAERIQQAEQAAHFLGNTLFDDLPFCVGVEPRAGTLTDLILNRTWKPALSVIGCDDVPFIKNAGNVTLPSLTLKLSVRLAPTTDPKVAAQLIKSTLEQNPPYHAQIDCQIHESGAGWNAPAEAPWLANAINQASMHYFNQPALSMGEGGSIPFMSMLGKLFPEAQFFITGVLGPGANAHGPNEFLHLPTVKKLTACIAEVLAQHYQNTLSN